MNDADLAVLGAGPAGVAAALEADALGLKVVLLDEAPAAGGQVYRAPSGGDAEDEDRRAGAALRAALAASRVTVLPGRRVWMLEPGFRLAALGPAGPERISAPRLIVAAGAMERHIPTSGWTLPGVMGLAAATILLKAERMLPGRAVVVAGTGPLLYLVAAKILAGGGRVAAVVDARPRSAWLRAGRALMARSDLALRGLGWMAKLRLSGVPLLAGHAVTAIEGEGQVARVRIAPLDAHGRPRAAHERIVEADAVCLGYGLVPATEATRLLGATHHFDAEAGGWVPTLNRWQESDVDGLFVAGDGAGIVGAAAAPLSGCLAAIGAAHAAGCLTEAEAQRRATTLDAALAKALHFGRAMTALSVPPAGLLAAMTDATTLCRCEGVTRATAAAAIDAGATSLVELKATTRCGMGPCGGRICGEAAAMLMAERTGRPRAAIPPATARPPLRPVPIAALAGDFAYEELPIPQPAPL
jgi:NADPH-dependent 2,4-dienoyl-CoA reductase/sulfur reductase-like enzyme/bacterioferritin-associated ferredoxin